MNPNKTKRKVKKEAYQLCQHLLAFGQSKYELKQRALAEGKPFWWYYAGKIFSFETYKTYYSLLKVFAVWCVDRYDIRSIYQITPRMFKSFIREHIRQKKASTLGTYLSAIAKFGEGRGRPEAFRQTARQLRRELPKGEKPCRPRFESVEQMAAVCAYVEERNARYGLAFKVEMDSACRVCELGFGREALGRIETRADGTEVGLLWLVGKGGRARTVGIGADLYRELDRTLEEGRVLVKPEAYRKAVYRAQRALGLRCCGTHKVRRTSAQAFFSAQYRELRSQGLASTEASRQGRQATAERLGHRRVRVTRAYVRG